MTNFYMGLIVATVLILFGLLLGMANRKKHDYGFFLPPMYLLSWVVLGLTPYICI